MLAEFSIIPLGTGESLGQQIASLVRIVEESGLDFRINAMGTVVEGDWEPVLAVIQRCHQTLLAASPRVVTSIRIDDRPAAGGNRLHGKIRSVEQALGRELPR